MRAQVRGATDRADNLSEAVALVEQQLLRLRESVEREGEEGRLAQQQAQHQAREALQQVQQVRARVCWRSNMLEGRKNISFFLSPGQLSLGAGPKGGRRARLLYVPIAVCTCDARGWNSFR